MQDNTEFTIFFEKSQNCIVLDHCSVLLATAADQLFSYMTLGSARYKTLPEEFSLSSRKAENAAKLHERLCLSWKKMLPLVVVGGG